MKYQVLVENGNQRGFIASVIGMPDCFGEAATKEEAIAKAKSSLAERLARAEIVTVELEMPRSKEEAPTLSYLGSFEDALTADDFLAEIAKYRRHIGVGDVKRLDRSQVTPASNPWLKYAGIFADDPTFDEFLENIAEYRREVDELEAAREADREVDDVEARPINAPAPPAVGAKH